MAVIQQIKETNGEILSIAVANRHNDANRAPFPLLPDRNLTNHTYAIHTLLKGK